MAYKPAGYNSLSPYLVVHDAEATLAFVEAVFSAKRLRVYHRDDGGIMHAEARIDDTVIMLGEMPESTHESMSAHLHVYVADVDAAFARAEAVGGKVVQAVESKPDGDRRGGIADPNGVVWWLATEGGGG